MSTPAAPETDPVAALVRRMIEQKDRDWLLLRSFYVVATSPSYRAAARALGLCDATAVRKRVHALERRLGGRGPVPLVATDGTGYRLTDAGRALRELLEGEFAPR